MNNDIGKIKEAYIFGNGFEISYNDYLRDFNNNFIQWFFQKSKNSDLFAKEILEVTGNNVKPATIVALSERIKTEGLNDLSNFQIESFLYKVGSAIKIEAQDSFEDYNLVFNEIKTIFGYYIDRLTICNFNFKKNNFNFLKNITKPFYVFTTNYTSTVKEFCTIWDNEYSYEKSKFFKPAIKFSYIHGYISSKYDNRNYENIQLNLEEKDGNELFNKIYSDWIKNKNSYKINFNIYGLNMINDIGVIRTLFEIQRSTNIQIEVTYWYYDKTDIESFKIECAKLNDQTIYKYTGENKIIKLAGAKILLCEFVGSKIVLNVPNASQSRYELEVKFSSVREHSLYNGLMNFNLSDFTTPVDIPNNLKQFIWKAKFGNNLIVACQYHLCPLYHEKLNFKDKDKIANNQWTVVPKWIIKFVDPYKNISNLKTEFKKICIDDLIIIHTFCSKHYDKFWQDNVFAYK